jgi:hypothetical protein
MNRAIILAALGSLMLTSALSAAPAKSPPPWIAIIHASDRKRQVVSIITYEYRVVGGYETGKNGKKPEGGTEEQEDFEPKTPDVQAVPVIHTLDGKGLKVVDIKGEKLADDDAWDRLKAGQAVLISYSPLIDPVYRTVLAEDALILVAPLPKPVAPQKERKKEAERIGLPKKEGET